MKKLDKEITKKVYSFRQLWRNNTHAIYEQVCKSRDVVVAYEIFKIGIQQEREFNGKRFEHMEKYPSPSQFGKTAWSVDSFSKAKLFIRELSFYGKVLKSDQRKRVKEKRIYLKNHKKAA